MIKIYDRTNINYNYSQISEPQGKIIGEIKEENFEFHTHYIIRGIKYYPTSYSSKNKFVEVEQYKNQGKDDENDFDWNDELICPNCGNRIDEAYEYEGEESCPYCGAEIEVEKDYSITYTTKLINKPKIIKIKGI